MKLPMLSEQSIAAQMRQIQNRIKTLQTDLQYADSGAYTQINDEIASLQKQMNKLKPISVEERKDKDTKWLHGATEMIGEMWERYENYKSNVKPTDRENQARRYFKLILSRDIESRVYSVLRFLKESRMTVEEVRPLVQKWRLDEYLDIRKDIQPVVPLEEAGYKAVRTLHEILKTN